MEVDSDDEDDEEDEHDGEEVGAGAGAGGNEGGDGEVTANPGDPSPGGQDNQQGGVAPRPEGGNVGGVGEGGEPAESPSPMAHGVQGLGLPNSGSKAGDGGQQPRFGPQRMFMDEVRGGIGGGRGGGGVLGGGTRVPVRDVI